MVPGTAMAAAMQAVARAAMAVVAMVAAAREAVMVADAAEMVCWVVKRAQGARSVVVEKGAWAARTAAMAAAMVAATARAVEEPVVVAALVVARAEEVTAVATVPQMEAKRRPGV